MKVGFIGQSPLLNHGQAIVSRRICDGFHERGLEVTCLGIGQHSKKMQGASLNYPIFPTEDELGLVAFPFFLKKENPDLLFIHGDLMLVSEWITCALKNRFFGQMVIYFSVDAHPIYEGWLSPVRVATRSACYTECGAREAARRTGRPVETFPLGVDRRQFHPGDPARRVRLRLAIGWDDRFVAMYVARNIGTKQHPNLIRAMGKLRAMGVDDVLCYIHTLPVDRRRGIGGWDLPAIARQWGAEGAVVFPPDLQTRNQTSPLGTGDPDVPGEALQESNLARLGLVDRYRCADLYLHVSACEGFGLPLVEAMACGLPVAHTDDGAAMNEVCGEAGFRICPPTSDLTVFGGETFCHSPEEIARRLIEIRTQLEDPQALAEARKRSLERAASFGWEQTIERLHQLVLEASAEVTWTRK